MWPVIIGAVILIAIGGAVVSQKNQQTLAYDQPGESGYTTWASLRPGTRLRYGTNHYVITGGITYESAGHYICYRYRLRSTGTDSAQDSIAVYRQPDGTCWAEFLAPYTLEQTAEDVFNDSAYRKIGKEHLVYTSSDGEGVYEYRRFSFGSGRAVRQVVFEKFDHEACWQVYQAQEIAIERLQVAV